MNSLPAIATADAISVAAIVIALRHRLGFIDGERAAVELRAGQGLNRVCASPPGPISTKPKPRDCPVNLSEITLADSTDP